MREQDRCPGTGKSSVDGKCPVCEKEVRSHDKIAPHKLRPGQGMDTRPLFSFKQRLTEIFEDR